MWPSELCIIVVMLHMNCLVSVHGQSVYNLATNISTWKHLIHLAMYYHYRKTHTHRLQTILKTLTQMNPEYYNIYLSFSEGHTVLTESTATIQYPNIRKVAIIFYLPAALIIWRQSWIENLKNWQGEYMTHKSSNLVMEILLHLSPKTLILYECL